MGKVLFLIKPHQFINIIVVSYCTIVFEVKPARSLAVQIFDWPIQIFDRECGVLSHFHMEEGRMLSLPLWVFIGWSGQGRIGVGIY